MADGFGSLAPDADWAEQEAQAGLPYVLEKEAAERSAKRSWLDTANDVAHFPHRLFGALATPPSTPQAEQDEAAMMPETFVNPIVKNTADAVGEAIKSGLTATHDIGTGQVPMFQDDGMHPNPEAIRRGFDMASLAGGASVAGTAEKAAAASDLAAPYHALIEKPVSTLASDSGRPGGMIANADQLKELANQRRAQGWATGKSAPGWDFKRPDPEVGTPERAAAEARAAEQAAKVEAPSPLLSPDDRAFIAGGGFYSDAAKPGAVLAISEHAAPYHSLLEKPHGEAYSPLHETPGTETSPAAASSTDAAAPSRTGKAGVDERSGLGGSSGGSDILHQAQLSAERRAGGREPLPGLPTGPQLVNGEPFVPGPVARAHEVADRYMADKDFGTYFQPPEKYHALDPEHSTAIAKAFDEMKHSPNDPATKASYDALIKETRDQYRAIRESGLRLTPTDATTYPYHGNPRAVAKDVADNNHMAFFKTDAGFGSDPSSGISLKKHPMMQPSGETLNGKPLLNNDLFRIVHDYFGHIKNGYGFRAAGEDNAWRAHAAMYSDLARPAMTTETRGQNSWVNYGPHGEKNRTASGADTVYADQKVGLMPEWTMRDRSAPAPVVAYHGSPHTFDKFDPSKLGSGEGAQVYGKGLYFAEEPKVASMYRKQLSSSRAWEDKEGNPAIWAHVMSDLQNSQHEAIHKSGEFPLHGDQTGEIAHRITNWMEQGKSPEWIAKNYQAPAGFETAWNAAIEKAKDFRYNKSPGSSYQVAIDKDPERFLDWDKRFKDQHPDVQAATRPFLEARLAAAHEGRAHFERKAAAGDRSALRYIQDRPPPPKTIDNFKGSDIHKMMGLPAKDQDEAFNTSAQRLRDAGVPGIRYFDERSRSPATKLSDAQQRLEDAKSGKYGLYRTPEQMAKLEKTIERYSKEKLTRNYVTFDAPRILKRYEDTKAAAPIAISQHAFGSLTAGQDR